jgi:Anti-sigma factor NepR
MSKARKGERKPAIDRAAQVAIGHQLRSMYSELLSQPLPEKLLSTLLAIQQAEDATTGVDEVLRKAA